jgi:hypothetical protein
MKKVIFLDIDGTLIPSYYLKYMERLNALSQGTVIMKDLYGEFFAPDCIENLRTLIQHTQANIIFTSRWKVKGFDRLKAMWQYRYNFGKVLGCTPLLYDSIRGDEIDNWLISNHWDKYVILDDMSETQFNWYHLPSLVTCDQNYGFTKKELQKAIQILQ